MSSTLLYAELLLNIKTVTLIVSLGTEHTPQTEAILAADGETLTLHHNHEATSIKLPTRISSGGRPTHLSLPTTSPTKELTLRLRLEEHSPGLREVAQRDSENFVPWSAADLYNPANEDYQPQFCCANCGAVLVKDAVNQWKDLPNENWAEMMEFWHCHKPHHDHHAHDGHAGHNKGYAAGNRWRAMRSTGFVDLRSFVLHEQDCDGIKISSCQENTPPTLCCTSCDAEVGVVDEAAEGWRIFKWSIGIRKTDSIATEVYDVQKWIAAQLLAHIENQGVRKFMVQKSVSSNIDDETKSNNILLWVFTPDLSFSSSVDSRRCRALKVFWQVVPRPTSERQQESFSVEEVPLPVATFDALHDTLRSSASLLPSSAKKFQDWNVGLLERFER